MWAISREKFCLTLHIYDTLTLSQKNYDDIGGCVKGGLIFSPLAGAALQVSENRVEGTFRESVSELKMPLLFICNANCRLRIASRVSFGKGRGVGGIRNQI